MSSLVKSTWAVGTLALLAALSLLFGGCSEDDSEQPQVVGGSATAGGAGGGGLDGGSGGTGADGGSGGSAGFTVTVNVVQLSTTLSLSLNASESLDASADGAYSFTTALSDGASYDVTFDDPDGEDCSVQSGAASGTVAGANVQLTVGCLPLVRALYPSAPDWLDYLNSTGAGGCNAAGVSRYAECIHGGERRVAYVPGASDCSGVSAADSLDAFEWRCDDSGPYVQVVSRGLRDTAGLTDLIDFASQAFKQLSVEVISPLHTVDTPTGIWWGNTITLADHSTVLDQAGTIYLFADNPAVPLSIAADQVAVVVEPTTTISVAFDLGSALTVSNVDYSWVEGSFQLSSTSPFTVQASTAGLAVFRHLELLNFGTIQLDVTRASLVHGLHVPDSGGNAGVELIDNIGLGVEHVRVSSADICLLVDGAEGGYLRAIRVADCLEGVQIDNSSDMAVDDVTASGLYENAGLRIANSTRVYLSRATLAAVDSSGLDMDCADCSVQAVTGVHNKYVGIYLGGAGMWFANLLAVNNQQGIRFFNASGVGRNVVSTNHHHGTNTTYGLYLRDSAVAIHGFVKVGHSDDDCYLDNSSGLDTDCNPTDSSTFARLLSIDASSTFGGKVTGNDTVNDNDVAGVSNWASITDWTGFESPTRGWGVDGDAFPALTNVGQCTSGTDPCRIWEWALDDADTVALAVNGVPDGDDVISHAAANMLQDAIEMLGDGVGDDDGRCESHERCLHTPNVGAYQGHGALTAIAFTDGTIEQVELYGYAINGR